MKLFNKHILAGPFTQLILIFVAMIFFPIFGYTVYQWLEKDQSEQVIESIYDRQLKSVLFTVNQYSWDVFRSWMEETTAAVDTIELPDVTLQRLQEVLERHRPLTAILVGSANRTPIMVVKDDSTRSTISEAALASTWMTYFRQSSGLIQRAIQNAREGYIRPLPVALDPSAGDMISMVLFPMMNQDRATFLFAGLIMDQRTLIDLVLAPKFNEMGEDDFVFAVRKKSDARFLYLSQETSVTDFEKQENLWILPDLEMHIKLQGTTLRQLAHLRIRRNLLFLAIVNVMLIVGALILIRSVQTQVRLAKMKTDFVANVSHELRTPLSLIRMYAEMLDMNRIRSDEKRRHYYHTIFKESVRLSKLINNILDFSKIESKRTEFTFQPTFLPDLVEDTLDLYLFHLDKRGFRLEQQLDKTVPLISANPDSITQALVNLLDNAVKFSPTDKEIGVRLFVNGDDLVLEVRDKGIGIDSKDQKKIFEKFYRGGDSLVHDTKGSGLGLALVKHIMDIHNGRVQVFSRPGAGSVFQLLFPIKNRDKKWLVF
jgi:two-component system, OmpR family, phosphate regulon sensor histidine kinase PhoR